MLTKYTLTGAKESEVNGTAAYEYTYDELGRQIEIDETGSVVKQYSYDLANNRTAFTLVSGGVTEINTTYTYDNQNRLDTVRENGTVQATYTYDIKGNRDTLTYANGSSEEYDYNDVNWITSLTNKTGGTVLSSYNYTYYTDGNQADQDGQCRNGHDVRLR